MPRALLSVSDKTGIADLGRGLAARGFELVSTGGTARALADAGLAVTNVADLERHGLGLVDVVVVNLYPFVKAAANPATSFDTLVEEIDIGGPSLVRATAKNFRGVLVVVDPDDYPRALAALDDQPS